MTTYKQIMNIKSTIPEGQIGDWKVETFEVTKKDATFFNLRQAINARGREIEPGIYTKLTHYGSVIMSDTPSEKRDHMHFLMDAKGDILITGLGLGWMVEALFSKKEVNSITIIEKSQDVINLVGKHLMKNTRRKSIRES